MNIVLDRHVPTTVDQILPLVLPDFLSPFQARTSLSMLDFFVLLDSSSVNPRSSLLFFLPACVFKKIIYRFAEYNMT